MAQDLGLLWWRLEAETPRGELAPADLGLVSVQRGREPQDAEAGRMSLAGRTSLVGTRELGF